MITFGVTPFEPGNMLYVGIQEELIENVINDFVERITVYRRGICATSEVVEFLKENEIDYNLLSQYLKDKLDELDVY